MNAWAQVMLLWSWQALLLVALIFVVVRIARSLPAATRYSFWALGVIVLALLPAANALVRALPAPPPTVAPIAYVAQLPEITVEAVRQSVQENATPAGSLSDYIVPSLFAAWLMGVLVSVVRSVRAFQRWHRIARAAQGVDPEGFTVPIGYSTEVETPVVVGTVWPMIVLPASIETWTDTEQRRAILLHEFAHLRRRDHWMNVLQSILSAVFFFHPGVRYALTQLIVERELACDEVVLANGVNPSSYAEVLFKVAERSVAARRSDCPAFHSPGMILERRIEMIQSHQHNGSWHLPVAARMAIVLVLAILLLPRGIVSEEILALTPMAPPEIRLASLEPSAPPEPAPRAASAPASPQVAGAGTIAGRAIDATGALVPGVAVTLTGRTLDTPRTAITNGTGAYTFANVPQGQYSLETKLPGFARATRTATSRAGERTNQDVLMAVAGFETIVEVRATRLANPVPTPAPTTLPQRIGGEVSQAMLIFSPKPAYPAGARTAGIQDFVRLLGVVDKEGKITSLQLDSTQPGTNNTELIQAAMDAVKQWRYKPSTLNGVPIDITTSITVNFTLE